MEYLNIKLKFKNLKLIQSNQMFNFSLESVLIAHFVKVKINSLILDVGTNNAIIPLIIAQKYSNQITGVEINKEAFKIAQKNIILNKKELQIKILEQDFRLMKAVTSKFNLVICNPPFFSINNNSYNLTKKHTLMRNARHEYTLTLRELITQTKKVIINKGYFVITHRVERLQEVLNTLKENGFRPSRLKFIHPFNNKQAQTFLLESRFQSNTTLSVEPPIIIHNSDNNNFTDEVKKLYGYDL